MSDIEVKRKRLELSRVQLAKQEQEFKIEERMEEVARLQATIQIQLNRENELKEEINSLINKENK